MLPSDVKLRSRELLINRNEMRRLTETDQCVK